MRPLHIAAFAAVLFVLPSCATVRLCNTDSKEAAILAVGQEELGLDLILRTGNCRTITVITGPATTLEFQSFTFSLGGIPSPVEDQCSIQAFPEDVITVTWNGTNLSCTKQ